MYYLFIIIYFGAGLVAHLINLMAITSVLGILTAKKNQLENQNLGKSGAERQPGSAKPRLIN